MPRFKGVFASSQDPSGQTLSLTVESLGKVVIGVLAWFLASKGMDAATAQNQLQAILDLIVQSVPLVFALWHSMVMVWGLIRKLIPSVTPTVYTPTNVTTPTITTL